MVLSCLLTLYTAVMSFEILFPFGLWVSEPGWLLNHSQLCEGVPVSLKLLFKLGVGAVRQSILARIIWCCVCICVMHVFVSLLELSGGIVCLSCHTAIGLGLCKSIGLHSDWFSFLPRM